MYPNYQTVELQLVTFMYFPLATIHSLYINVGRNENGEVFVLNKINGAQKETCY